MSEIALSLSTTVRRIDGVIDAEIDGEAIALSLDHSRAFEMGPVGTRIWQLIDSRITVARLCEALLEEFEVDDATCRSEVFAFLSQLAREGLIETDEAG